MIKPLEAGQQLTAIYFSRDHEHRHQNEIVCGCNAMGYIDSITVVVEGDIPWAEVIWFGKDAIQRYNLNKCLGFELYRDDESEA